MKPCIKNLSLLPILIAVLGLVLAGPVTGQTFTTLYSFTAGSGSFPNITNSDGAKPHTGLILWSNTLYGTAPTGGSSGNGTLFKVNTDGMGFTNLHNFTAPSGPYPPTNSDGAGPLGGLILSGNTLYGTASSGGSSGNGTLFKVNTDGTGFTSLYSFTAYGSTATGFPTNSDGAVPQADLILSGGTLYGTATYGGSSGNGTAFAINTDGTGFTNLHSFAATPPYPGPYTNTDGTEPRAGLTISGSTLYGTAYHGGSSGMGTVFAINTDGTRFTNLHSFTGSDGGNPSAGLLLSGNTLYGTAYQGGSSGNGTVFKVKTDGTDFTNLYSFTATSASPPYTNSDGASPIARLVLSGNTLYGTALYGGSSDNGTMFKVNTDGTGFTTLYSFSAGSGSGIDVTNSDGAGPQAGLNSSGGTLYGTAAFGGSSGNGTVFSFSFRPPLTITAYGTNVILTWPTNAFSFTLQSTTNLGALAVWTTNLPSPVAVNGQNTVTNPISSTKQFFRLSQ